MSEKKQTAVEWLHEQLLKGEFINDPDELIRQAKEMENEQIRIAYMEGAFAKMRHLDGKGFIMPKEYYSKTYSK